MTKNYCCYGAYAEAGHSDDCPTKVEPGRIKLPTNEEEAAGMALVGENWLRTHAPHRLKAPALMADGREAGTSSSQWRSQGAPDPHGERYNVERSELAMGTLTDDELANGAFMNYDVRPPLQDIIDGKANSPIAWMMAVQDRIRWLSRSLEAAIASTESPSAPAPAVPEPECAASGQSCQFGPHGPGGSMQCQYCGEQAPSLVVAAPAPAVAEGWVCVSKEPTDKFVKRVANFGVWSEQEVRNLYRDIVLGAVAAAPAGEAEPVAWRHSHTHALHDFEEEVELADGDSWAEPLYLATPTQATPAPLSEAVDEFLETAPCECSYKRRHEDGEHLSGCYLFDLNLAALAARATPAPKESK